MSHAYYLLKKLKILDFLNFGEDIGLLVLNLEIAGKCIVHVRIIKNRRV